MKRLLLLSTVKPTPIESTAMTQIVMDHLLPHKHGSTTVGDLDTEVDPAQKGQAPQYPMELGAEVTSVMGHRWGLYNGQRGEGWLQSTFTPKSPTLRPHTQTL